MNNGGSPHGQRLFFQLAGGDARRGQHTSLTNNTFGGTLYCTLPYVSQLTNNTSFGVVDISGGT